MTPEEYYRELKETRDKVWAHLLAEAAKGKHATKETIAQVVFDLGLDSASPAAEYVARRLAGDIRVPRGNPGHRRKAVPDDDWLRWLYRFELEDLQILYKSDRKKYEATYGKRHDPALPPAKLAMQKIAKEHGVSLERMRKLSKGVAVK